MGSNLTERRKSDLVFLERSYELISVPWAMHGFGPAISVKTSV